MSWYKKQKLIFARVCFIMFLFVSTFCLSKPMVITAAPSKSVTLSTSSLYLSNGETYKLKVTGTTKKIKWLSANKKVATVSGAGKVKAVGYGISIISATVNNISYKCKITVINPAEIFFQPIDTKVIVNGSGVNLNPVSYQYNIDEIKKAGLTYEVVGNSGVKVTSAGEVASTQAGKFEVVAYFHGKKLSTIAMEAITFDGFTVSELTQDKVSMDTNKRELISFAGNILPIYKNVKVSSSNSAIAEVEVCYHIDLNGEINRCKGIYVKSVKEGICTITVTICGVAKELKVIVGDGYKELSPVEAIQKNDLSGYSGAALTTLTAVRKFMDENNLFSSSLSDKEKITIIQKYLNKNYSGKLIDETYEGYISGVFLTGSGVCASYAETMCFLCECLGIEVYYCVGTADNGDGTGFGGHGWNKVKADGTWYYIDTYWNAGQGNLKYFLSETLWSNHQLRVEDYFINIMNSGEVSYSGSIQ